MRNTVSGVFFTLLSLISVSAMAIEAEEYDLTCSYKGSEQHAMQFRLNARYEVAEDGSAALSGVDGLLFADPDLQTLELYDVHGDKTITNDESYKPRKGGKYENHAKFILEPVKNAGEHSSGGRNYLLISLEPTSVKRKPVKNVPNPGIEINSTFHAGLEYYLGDYGSRTEITCKGYQYVSDRTGK
jgi:hypothetical protein